MASLVSNQNNQLMDIELVSTNVQKDVQKTSSKRCRVQVSEGNTAKKQTTEEQKKQDQKVHTIAMDVVDLNHLSRLPDADLQRMRSRFTPEQLQAMANHAEPRLEQPYNIDLGDDLYVGCL